MITLKLKRGWAVRITRADGSWFFSIGPLGQMTPLWDESSREYADRGARELRANQFNARVVKVLFAHPMLLAATKPKRSRVKA